MVLTEEIDLEKLALVAEKIEDSVVITDKYGVVEWVNEAFTNISGYSLQEILGKKPGDLLQGPATSKEDVRSIQENLKSGNSFVSNILNYAKSGKTYWLRLSITPIRDDYGQITNFISIQTDVTKDIKDRALLKKGLDKHKEAEEKLARAIKKQEQLSNELMLAELRFKSTFKQENNIKSSLQKYRSDLVDTQNQLINNEKMASIGLLTAGIAHEINNPLNFISSGVSSLKAIASDIRNFMQDLDDSIVSQLPQDKRAMVDQIKSDHELDYVLEDMSQMLDDVETGSKRTIEIINSLRLSARGDEEEKVSAAVHNLIDASLILLKKKTEGINITKTYKDQKEILCYPGPLSQVFTNIIANALQAIPSGRKGKIDISTYQKKDVQYISIKDNGTGIPEKIAHKIFEPSFTTKKVGEGTGLGMSISKDIIDKKHKGQLSFTSKIDEGTTFIIQIPMK